MKLNQVDKERLVSLENENKKLSGTVNEMID
jgi:hypothetical protein